MESFHPSNMESHLVYFHNIVLSNKYFWKCRYAVFGLGSSAYPHFAAFAFQIDESLRLLGAEAILPIETGDELNAQEKTFKKWSKEIYKACCDQRGVTGKETGGEQGEAFFQGQTSWRKGRFRLAKSNSNAKEDLSSGTFF